MRRLIDMQCAAEFAAGGRILAYGTSEGVTEAWDSRGRTNQEIGNKLRSNGFKKTSESPTKRFSTWTHQDGRVLSWNHKTNVILHKASGQEWAPDMHAGGPGSGCQGPNCGRKPGYKWKVSEPPTGRYRSFERREWPHAKYETGQPAAMLYSEDEYNPSDAATGNHNPLTLRVADYSQTPFKWRKAKGQFSTLQQAKDAFDSIVKANPGIVPKGEAE